MRESRRALEVVQEGGHGTRHSRHLHIHDQFVRTVNAPAGEGGDGKG